ncbi:MAG: XRE family transcriptional regulator [Clostridia bacterium]|nr:XRE family transcriptional regulator [Clostridia bacterium]
MFEAKKLAENIKKGRQKLGLTQQTLAERIFVSGQAISKWETGQSVPDLENLCQLAELFSTSVDNLLGQKSRTREEKVFIGIDGGATKTEFLLFTESGVVLERILRAGCNPNVCGLEQAFEILKDSIDTLLQKEPDVFGVFAGIAGFMSGENGKNLYALLNKKYPLLKKELGSDILNVIYSSHATERCLAVILGTGAAVYANEQGKLSRIGAWGYLLDELGGGFGLGKAALQASLAERDGFGRKTLLTTLTEERLGTTVWDSIDKIYKGGDSFIASFAPLVFEACEQGDEVADEILEKFSQNVADHLQFARKAYNCGEDVIVAGGLIQQRPELSERIRRKTGDCPITIPTLPQIYGACKKCVMTFGNLNDKFEENFSKSYAVLL